MIGVFVVDDHEIFRRGVVQLVDAEPDLRIVGEAGTFQQAKRRIAATLPDVAVLDARLPDGDGVALCRNIRSAHPLVACLILTAYDDDAALRAAVLAGASGYVLKDVHGDALLDAIRRAAVGTTIQSAEVLKVAARDLRAATPGVNDHLGSMLSPRETEVLELIAEALTNRQIGDQLGVSEKTIKNYVSSVLAKLGMERRTQALAYASAGTPGRRTADRQ